MNELNGIFEDVTKANLEQQAGKIMTLAVENGFYEFLPGGREMKRGIEGLTNE